MFFIGCIPVCFIHLLSCISHTPRGHTHDLLEARVHSERVVEAGGVALQPPQIDVVRTPAGRACKLSTAYMHSLVEIWCVTEPLNE